jgi:hypothetical protein
MNPLLKLLPFVVICIGAVPLILLSFPLLLALVVVAGPFAVVIILILGILIPSAVGAVWLIVANSIGKDSHV